MSKPMNEKVKVCPRCGERVLDTWKELEVVLHRISSGEAEDIQIVCEEPRP